MKKQHEKYTLGGESPLVRVNFLISKEIYRKLHQYKNENGIAINFFVQKAIEKALKEREKR